MERNFGSFLYQAENVITGPEMAAWVQQESTYTCLCESIILLIWVLKVNLCSQRTVSNNKKMISNLYCSSRPHLRLTNIKENFYRSSQELCGHLVFIARLHATLLCVLGCIALRRQKLGTVTFCLFFNFFQLTINCCVVWYFRGFTRDKMSRFWVVICIGFVCPGFGSGDATEGLL